MIKHYVYEIYKKPDSFSIVYTIDVALLREVFPEYTLELVVETESPAEAHKAYEFSNRLEKHTPGYFYTPWQRLIDTNERLKRGEYLGEEEVDVVS